MFVRVKIDDRSKAAKSFLEFVKTLPFAALDEEDEDIEEDTVKFRPKNSKFRPLPSSSHTLTPHIKAERVYAVFQILKEYFHLDKQPALKILLQTGENPDSHKLLFLDNANRLADTFKKLFEHDFMSSCKKQDLQAWIVKNFQYMYRGKVADISESTIERYISSMNGEIHCKRPLIDITDGHIVKA